MVMNEHDHHLIQHSCYSTRPKIIEEGEIINIASSHLNEASQLETDHLSSSNKVTHFNYLKSSQLRTSLGLVPLFFRVGLLDKKPISTRC